MNRPPHVTHFFLAHVLVSVSSESTDPAVIRSIAVSADDLVTALETTETSSTEAVLRVTPPFSGRMRARLHIDRGTSYTDEPEPLHISPRSLVDDTVPSYPKPAETANELRSDPSVEYSVERHHARHRDAVEQWRKRVPEAVKEQATVETAAGSQTISVTVLGDSID